MGKEQIGKEIDKIKDQLIKLSHQIHENPETGGNEHQAVKWQKELLTANGFSFESPYCGMDTAYLAVRKGKGDGPVISYLAEYDALEGLGHGCAHNMIASISAGAAIGLANALGDQAGEIRIYGTPAEETWGGKIPMVEQGAFDGVDFAMMVHPSTKNIISRPSKACVGVIVRYTGKSAHSASPETGINALTAMIGLFNRMFEGLKKWPEGGRANGIITEGGTASNVITEEAEGRFILRAHTLKDLQIIMDDFKEYIQEAAAEVGAKVTMNEWESPFAERYANKVMGRIFADNMKGMGEIMNLPEPGEHTGSSDIGNVSLVVPAIHEYIAIADPSVNGHSVPFREAAASQRGDEAIILAAKGLAMTGYDLFTNKELCKAAKKEFADEVESVYKK